MVSKTLLLLIVSATASFALPSKSMKRRTPTTGVEARDNVDLSNIKIAMGRPEVTTSKTRRSARDTEAKREDAVAQPVTIAIAMGRPS